VNKYFDSILPDQKKAASESFVTSKVELIVENIGVSMKPSTLRDYFHK